MKIEKIWIYGGAFNPPTRWHKKVVQWVLEQWLVDTVIFAPTGEREDKSYGITSYLRERLLKIFYSELIWAGFTVDWCDYFLQNKQNALTTTIGMDEYFQSKYHAQIHHIFGVDVIPRIPSWSGNEKSEVENRLRKIFIPRKGYELPKDFSMPLSHMLDVDIPQISSTLAREMIQTKKDVSELLTPWVAEFIQQNNLYSK